MHRAHIQKQSYTPTVTPERERETERGELKRKNLEVVNAEKPSCHILFFSMRSHVSSVKILLVLQFEVMNEILMGFGF